VTSRLVIDASVALKWMTPDEDSERAMLVLDVGRELHAPAFIFMELANALWTQARAGKTDATGASAALDDVRTGPLRIWQGEEPLSDTIALATTLDHAVYDCAYLALALQVDAAYVTADHRFWCKTQSNPQLAERVLLLRDMADRI
jgi:predicted nucleic acid-binding protein